METLKQVLALPLLATVVWLAWVFGLQTGVNGLTGLLAALLLIGLAAWVGARWGGIAAKPATKTIARIAAVVIAFGAVVVLVRSARISPPSPADAGGATATEEWRTWSPAAADAVRAAEQPLFIDFTAAWCLSCQVNERVVFNSAAVRDAFRDHGVVLMKADWTRRDPAITAALAKLERSSVPVYALYPVDASGAGDPLLLPSVLTKDIVLDALETYVPSRN